MFFQKILSHRSSAQNRIDLPVCQEIEIRIYKFSVDLLGFCQVFVKIGAIGFFLPQMFYFIQNRSSEFLRALGCSSRFGDCF